jgi:hypothetical protein
MSLASTQLYHGIVRQPSLKECKEWLTGKYSNIEQFREGAARGKLTARDGGHEFVTAEIFDHPDHESVVVATYFFGEDREKCFRFRYYEFVNGDNGLIIMKLHRPLLSTEQKLKDVKYDVNSYLPDLTTEFEYLEGCNIQWTKGRIRNFYLGELINGSCNLCSLTKPDLQLTIKDELRLWKDTLWINDRVYTLAGDLIIGNIDGIPYKFKKIIT